MRRFGRLVAATVTVLGAVVGCDLHAGGPCPMYVSTGGLSVQAEFFVEAHPQSAVLQSCLGGGAADCGSPGSPLPRAGTIVLRPRTPPFLTYRDVAPGRYWVRVVVTDKAGTRLVDAGTAVRVRHDPGVPGCPNTAVTAGGVGVNADGSLTAS